jgi:hypothetical protein
LQSTVLNSQKITADIDTNNKIKLLDKVRITLRTNHYNKKTEIPELKKHLNELYKEHKTDLLKNKGATILLYALARKYPNAGKEFGWQNAFSADKFIKDENNGLGVKSPLD